MKHTWKVLLLRVASASITSFLALWALTGDIMEATGYAWWVLLGMVFMVLYERSGTFLGVEVN